MPYVATRDCELYTKAKRFLKRTGIYAMPFLTFIFTLQSIDTKQTFDDTVHQYRPMSQKAFQLVFF